MIAPLVSPRMMRVGGGAVAQTAEVLAAFGLSRPLVVTDPYMVKSGLIRRCLDPMEAAGLHPTVFSDTVPEPTDAVIEAGVAALSQGDYDCLVGFGGGSPIDTAKAMAILSEGRSRNPAALMRDFKVPFAADQARLPIIAIPTTAGTGSEATRFTVITDEARGEKMLIAGMGALPLAAIVDYELTFTVPPRITADTGVDSLTHALEAYVSKRANPYSDTQALAAHGLTAQQVLDTVESAYSGTKVGQTFRGTRTVDAVVLLPPDLRNQPARLGELSIAGPLGTVPLSQVARISVSQDRYSIEHDGGQRRVSVTFNVGSGSLQNVVQEAQRAITAHVVLPKGVFLEFTGAAAAEQQTRNQLYVYSGFALALIVMILFVSFHWRLNGWLVLANLPFSLIGSVLAIAVTGIGVSLGTVVGLVTVFGVSARNAILQLSHYEHLVEVEGAPWGPETMMRGANERLVPILLTAAVTALGLAPLAIGLNQPGRKSKAQWR